MIDSLDDLERCSIDRQRFADFIYALPQWFAVENITSIMTAELRELYEPRYLSNDEVSNMSDNLVMLGFTPGERMKRTKYQDARQSPRRPAARTGDKR